jgi:hypothetical protein
MPVRDTRAMLAGMRPRLRPELFTFVGSEDPDLAAKAIALFREDEGTSLVLRVADARGAGLEVDLPMACITLGVESALDGVGLTAAVAGVLAEHDIPCNMVAALRHDHAFVPAERAEEALALLLALSAKAG